MEAAKRWSYKKSKPRDSTKVPVPVPGGMGLVGLEGLAGGMTCLECTAEAACTTYIQQPHLEV